MSLLITRDMYETKIQVILDKNLIRFSYCSYTTGYHFYMNICSPLLREFLRCKKDVENEYDVHAVAVEKR